MTVQELIEKLSRMPSQARVVKWRSDYQHKDGYDYCEGISMVGTEMVELTFE